MDGEILSDEENHNLEMDFDNDESNHGTSPADEAIEVPAGDPTARGEVIKPKKVVRNPQPKLDSLRLMGPRGIGILSNSFKKHKFKGKGHEKEDLNLLMKELEHWSHRLFPKLTFDDMLKQLEKLGTKKEVNTLIKKLRLDMLQSDELLLDKPIYDDNDNQVVQTEDVFDQLLPADRLPNEDSGFTFSNVANIQPQLVTMSAEDKERMERNKQMALERRRIKLLEKETDFSQTFASQNDSLIKYSTNSITNLAEEELDEETLMAFEEESMLLKPSKNISSPNKQTIHQSDENSVDNSEAILRQPSHNIASPNELTVRQNDENSTVISDADLEKPSKNIHPPNNQYSHQSDENSMDTSEAMLHEPPNNIPPPNELLVHQSDENSENTSLFYDNLTTKEDNKNEELKQSSEKWLEKKSNCNSISDINNDTLDIAPENDVINS